MNIVKAQSAATEQVTPKLFGEIRSLIEASRAQVVQTVNSTLVMLYWQIGTRIRKGVLGEERAEYGQQIVSTLSQQLATEYREGFSKRNLFNMIRFAEAFPQRRIVQTLSAQLSWSHLLELIAQDDPLKREFYAEMCRVEHWSVRTLEASILREIESFILELGVGFSFIARQKRIAVDGEDYYIDPLFFRRRLGRLVAIDFKLGAFKAADKGQMELYLRWLEKHEMQPGGRAADWINPLCGKIEWTGRAPATCQERHPCGGVHNGTTATETP